MSPFSTTYDKRFRDWIKRICPSPAFQSLYIAYTLSAIGDRMWSFAIIFILQQLGGLRLVSTNLLIENVLLIITSTYVGTWLDNKDRKKGLLAVLAVNNLSITASALLLFVCLQNDTGTGKSIWLGLAIFGCALAALASQAQKTAFTKDWMVTMNKDEAEIPLSRRNATMKTIDQLSSMIAPLIAGMIFVNADYKMACLFFVVWNLISWLIEAILLIRVYKLVKNLSERCPNEENEEKTKRNFKKNSGISMFIYKLTDSLAMYWRQSIHLAGFGLAILYMTVLGFDGVSLSYGKSQGVPEDLLGLYRSIGSVFGLAGAVAYTLTETKIGVRRTGVIGFLIQQTFLYLCVVSIWLPGSPFDPYGYLNFHHNEWWKRIRNAFVADESSNILNNSFNITQSTTDSSWLSSMNNNHSKISVIIFLSGIAFARLGLWMGDLSITQIMQEMIAEDERNTVFGVQGAICRIFSMAKDIMVISFPDPKTFGFLIIVSMLFVTSGFVLYCVYLIKSRNRNDLIRSSEADVEVAEPLNNKNSTDLN